MRTIHIRLSGKVQGVFFRASAKETADKLKISGWVKNTSDGDVEILAEGTSESIQKFIQWCKEGPPKAIVSHLHFTETEPADLKNFSILK
ncbi:MAG TPA: acylphosphatase [Flavisolibacter sp.]|nr:acylphosphatase [Flavisolibacter sp.]